MTVSRREFGRLLAGAGMLSAVGQLSRASMASAADGTYRAMVGVFLVGGNDGFNTIVPTDSRYSAYAQARGGLALPQNSLIPLAGSAFGMHPGLAPLKPIWDAGAMTAVLNVGSLFMPLDKATYLAKPDYRPLNLMSHADEQQHWQGLRMRDFNADGFMGRLTDRMPQVAVPSAMSIAGASLAVMGVQTSPLVLAQSGSMGRNGWTPGATDGAIKTRQAAVGVFANGSGIGTVSNMTGQEINAAYAQSDAVNGLLNGASTVDAYFVDPVSKQPLQSSIAKQLQRTARMIQAHSALGQNRQSFFTTHSGFDNHVGQALASNPTLGTHANLLNTLAIACAAFYNCMKGLGLSNNVTLFTMSDFGRTLKPNAQTGSDHAWGNNHFVIGGGLKPKTIYGRYPDLTLGGPEDAMAEGRFIPSIAIEEYLSPIANWHGVAGADMAYVFPNWSTWNGGGRGPVPMFA